MSKHRNRIQQNPGRTNTSIEVTRQSVSFSGPLPHPRLLAEYNEVIPNGAERIMAMAERQSAHREALEARVIGENVASQKRGSIFAFIICLVALVGGFSLIAMGKNGSGLAAIISSLAALAGVFVYGKYQQRKEREGFKASGAFANGKHNRARWFLPGRLVLLNEQRWRCSTLVNYA